MPTRILIADDNPVVRTAVRQLLESTDHWEITEVENGREAIAKAQELRPNLIILDLVMPVMDGLAAARELSKILPNTPLLMNTLHWSPQVEVEAQKVGVRKVVSKVESQTLVSVVREVLAKEPPASIAEQTVALTMPPPVLHRSPRSSNPPTKPLPNHPARPQQAPRKLRGVAALRTRPPSSQICASTLVARLADSRRESCSLRLQVSSAKRNRFSVRYPSPAKM